MGHSSGARPLKRRAARPLPSALLLQTQVAGVPVQERGLVVTDLRAEDVVLEHRSYCSAKALRKHFAGDVLGYVTPVRWALGRRVRGQGGAPDRSSGSGAPAAGRLTPSLFSASGTATATTSPRSLRASSPTWRPCGCS